MQPRPADDSVFERAMVRAVLLSVQWFEGPMSGSKAHVACSLALRVTLPVASEGDCGQAKDASRGDIDLKATAASADISAEDSVVPQLRLGPATYSCLA